MFIGKIEYRSFLVQIIEIYSDLEVKFHTKIVNEIKERDEEMAEQLMREHIEINQNYLDGSFYH